MAAEQPTRAPRSRRNIRRRAAAGTWWCTRAPTCRAPTPRTSCAATCNEGPRVTSEAGPPDPEPEDAAEGQVVELPAAPRVADVAIDELEMIYAFIYSRVGNRADAEDLTQQVAMKAIPRLRQGAPASAVRGYLFATARSVLGGFWSTRLRLSESELHEDLAMAMPQRGYSEESVERVRRVLEQLSDNYRRVLELRFLHGDSLKEVAGVRRSPAWGGEVSPAGGPRAAAQRGPA